MYKMQRLEVSGAVRPLWWSLDVKGLTKPEGKLNSFLLCYITTFPSVQVPSTYIHLRR